MATQDTHSNLQAVRRLYENATTTNSSSALAETIYVAYHPDISLGNDIILWDDILSVFSTALYIRSGAVALPFLKGPNFKNLDPLRITAVPGVTLDVLEEKELSMLSVQKALPDIPQESISESTATTPNASTKLRRNPVGGLVEKAMDAYRDNDNPAFRPRLRGPQAILDEKPVPPTSDTSSPPTSDTPPALLKPMSTPQTLSVQGPTSANSSDFYKAMKKAKRGDKNAQYALGDMYYHAEGVKRDYQSAMEWYIKAANQGHVEAQNDIAFMYRHGKGVPQDDTLAMEWYRKAAKQGHAQAMNDIGFLYQHGNGIPQDYASAMSWYRWAADKGLASAQSNVGYLYQYGLGVSRNYPVAMSWYRKAADQGLAAAQSNVGHMYKYGLGVAQDYSAAMEWCRKAADQGYHFNVAWTHEYGVGVPEDRGKAIKN
ncbi:hypothetical protein EC991_006080 [Linnemannia zychae]|nr:hypothetical protein EC991_006080 [Linnemannia zychae]